MMVSEERGLKTYIGSGMFWLKGPSIIRSGTVFVIHRLSGEFYLSHLSPGHDMWLDAWSWAASNATINLG